MRLNSILLFTTLLSGSLLAQDAATNTPAAPAETPAAAPATTNAAPATVTDSTTTNAVPVKKKAATKKKSAKKPAAKKKVAGAELKTVPLTAGPAVVDANHVNVRGQAKLNSEVVTRLSKGQKVTVIEEKINNNSAADEPSAWAKIALPSDVHVWVNSSYIDAATKTVKPKKLNVRSGPGENFSVLGQLAKGDAVNQVNTKGDWTEIEAPTNAFAFVAAQYLKQEPAGTATTPAEAVATTATVTNDTAIAAAASEAPTNAPTADLGTNATAVASATAYAASGTDTNTPPAQAEEPPPRRVVEREGLVRGTTSIQAPTHFELVSPENHRTIDYLYTTSPSLDLRRYKGLRIIVTGEEGLEERWGNTPVITIEKIQVVE